MDDARGHGGRYAFQYLVSDHQPECLGSTGGVQLLHWRELLYGRSTVGRNQHDVRRAPFPNRLFALDLNHPGSTLWVFTPHVNEFASGQACCGIVNRGAAYSSSTSNSSHENLVIYSTLDDQVIAVNAATGAQAWRTSLGSPRTGQTMTGAAFVVNSNGKDIVVVGNAGAEVGVRGWVAALDAGTGAKVWQFYNTGSDADVGIDGTFAPFYAKDQGTNLGQTTWPGSLYLHGGSAVWGWLTYDSVHNLIFYGTAQPAPWDAEMRQNPGGSSDNKWSSSIVARNPGTGKAVWAYQVTPHDNWDFDSISESIVATLSNFNHGSSFLAHFDKNGYAYTLDARTGKVLVAKPFVSVNWSTGIDLATGAPNVNPARTTQEGVVTPDICPSPIGGKNHHPAAFSPLTGLFYIPANKHLHELRSAEGQLHPGDPLHGCVAWLRCTSECRHLWRRKANCLGRYNRNREVGHCRAASVCWRRPRHSGQRRVLRNGGREFQSDQLRNRTVALLKKVCSANFR